MILFLIITNLGKIININKACFCRLIIGNVLISNRVFNGTAMGSKIHHFPLDNFLQNWNYYLFLNPINLNEKPE